MTLGWIQAAGGLGLFLLGMVTMTDGLRQTAGDALQRLLRRFTRSAASGALTGALVTAIVQSSSAVTVSAVGFAGAGLLSFREALGIVFGANIGTTMTGWMVVLLGFKLQLGLVAPLAILAGVLLRIFGRRRAASIGTALAGFGLIFLGIDALRGGLSGLEAWIPTDQLPADRIAGRLLLVGMGILITLITQSSSAGVATAITALSTGAIDFAQAASLVIGMDMGTTVKAALATIGGSLPARRTGWAHVIYNLFSGTLAFVLAPLYQSLLEAASPGVTIRQPEVALVAFHTSFNTLGVLIAVPFAGRFAQLIERLVPERSEAFRQRLDTALLAEPELALRALAPTLAELAERSFAVLQKLLQLGPNAPPQSERVGLLSIALVEVQRYIGLLRSPFEAPSSAARRVAALHLVDQLRRLLGREERSGRAAELHADPELRRLAMLVASELEGALDPPAGAADTWPEARLEATRTSLREGRKPFRTSVAQQAMSGELDPDEALDHMDAYRWLERVTHHAWRVVHHLGQVRRELPTPLVVEPSEPE